jgi:hypothetical protein
MAYTLAEAAAAVGMDKTTIRRAVRAGRISGTRDEAGVWHVEPVELHRVFPPLPSAAGRPDGDTTALPRDAAPDAAGRTTDALVAELRAVIADLRQDRDEWREQAKRLALAAPVPAPAPVDAGGPLYRAWRWVRQAG